jgi:hypothetical protein
MALFANTGLQMVIPAFSFFGMALRSSIDNGHPHNQRRVISPIAGKVPNQGIFSLNPSGQEHVCSYLVSLEPLQLHPTLPVELLPGKL